MKKASLYGLSFRTDVDLDGNELKAPITDSYREFAYGAYSLISRRYYRPIGEPPIPARDGTNSNVNETIDASVFARWNADTTYRPQNLVDWSHRYGADISRLTSSVLADGRRQSRRIKVRTTPHLVRVERRPDEIRYVPQAIGQCHLPSTLCKGSVAVRPDFSTSSLVGPFRRSP
jgi:hypothetical protein